MMALLVNSHLAPYRVPNPLNVLPPSDGGVGAEEVEKEQEEVGREVGVDGAAA